MTATRFGALLGLIALALHAAPSSARENPASDASEQCKALQTTDFASVQDAPAQINAAALMEPKGDVPSYCQVKGYVMPQVGFDIRLPASGWNGKFLEVGCGGTCGRLLSEVGVCDSPLRKGYACIVSDMGHKGDGSLWAYSNPQAKIDFAYRATHVAALIGKAITERYYRKAPGRSYYMGCSTGGRQGMVSAQRFPWDFDGIIAGAPPIDYTTHVMNSIWTVMAVQGGSDGPVLSASAIERVHEAALAKCDLDDGVKDGIIGNPLACKFEPSDLVCKSDTKTGCLTQIQADTAKKVYSGITTSRGDILLKGSAVGSELNWIATYADMKGSLKKSRLEQLQYMLFLPDAGSGLKATDIDFDRDYKRLGMTESLYSASNPDLRKFKAAGGKLIVYHGWNDEFISPAKTIDYYETVQRTMGGRKTTEDFFRLFMLPGVDHCAGGVGADAVDFLGHLEAWVERGQAPEKILTAHITEKPATEPYPYRQLPANLDSSSFTRPVYPYPLRAKYTGKGDPNDDASFRPVEP